MSLGILSLGHPSRDIEIDINLYVHAAKGKNFFNFILNLYKPILSRASLESCPAISRILIFDYTRQPAPRVRYAHRTLVFARRDRE